MLVGHPDYCPLWHAVRCKDYRNISNILKFCIIIYVSGFNMFADLLLDEREVIDEELYAEFLSKSCRRLINEVNALDLLPTLLENGTIT